MELQAGDELPEASYEMGWNQFLKFNRYVSGGEDTKNIHTDDTIARKAGLPGAIAAGRHPASFISERMVELFGTGFISGGDLDVTFVKPIFPGDILRLTAKVKEKREEDGNTRVVLEVALVNQDGAPVTVGTASGLANG